VNIRAAMAALAAAGLDHMAKMAVLVVACRADRHTGAATLSIDLVASDLEVTAQTARRALYRAVDAGWLTVENHCGQPNVWRLPLVADHRGTPMISSSNPYDQITGDPCDLVTPNRSLLEKDKEGANSTSSLAPLGKTHPAGCACGGVGMVIEAATNRVMPCPLT
jgi:hypothetical protein